MRGARARALTHPPNSLTIMAFTVEMRGARARALTQI